MNKVTIYVGTQVDGCTFELEPASRRLVKSTRADESPLPRSLFIGCDTRQDFIRILGEPELRWTIAEVLSGLKREQLSQVGQLEWLDPSRDFAPFDPAVA